MKSGYRYLSLRICSLVIALWLLLAGLLTWAVAQDFQRQLHDRTTQLVHFRGLHHSLRIPDSTPGYGSLIQIRQLGDPLLWLRTDPLFPIVLPQTPDSYGTSDWFWGDWELLYGFRSATVFFDEAGKPLVKSGTYLSMLYITEEHWDGQIPAYEGAAYIDIEKLTQETGISLDFFFLNDYSVRDPSNFFSLTIRSTGYFQGDEFIPVILEVGREGPWETLLHREPPADVELVTIYSWQTGGFAYAHEPVTCNGKTYASLTELALEAEPNMSAGNLWRTVFTLTGTADESTGASTFRIAICTQPLRYAALRLLPFYFCGTLTVAVCLWVLLRSIRKHLAQPLAYAAIDLPITPSSGWREVRKAEEQIQAARLQIRTLENDNQRLSTALAYAKDAEENRRQLISNITHELKTPLAVIHSYAEGLQAGIAAEKTDDYLSTILEEAEKMDAMVLEMLDMSRLEAGKVRLGTDQFSLAALSQEIIKKLAPEESRCHTITFQAAGDCTVVGDEGRIAQVVTNLVSNALKYTPPGGNIWLQVSASKSNASFILTNSANHLSEEALEKIFEPFYRVDSARSDRGTGLGLPIARSIIHLHRGQLTARNVWEKGQPCLEFAFVIPLQ